MLVVLVVVVVAPMDQMEETLKLREVLQFFYKVLEDLVAHMIWQDKLLELVVVEDLLVVRKEMAEALEVVEKVHGLIVVAAVVVLLVIVVTVEQEDMLDIVTILDLMDLVAAVAVAALDNLQEDLVHLVVGSVF